MEQEREMSRNEDPFDEGEGRPVYTSRRFGGRGDRSDGRRTVLLVLVGALVLGGLGWFAWNRYGAGDGAEPAPERSVASDSAATGDRRVAGEALRDTSAEPLPPLDESDALVRRLGEGLSTRPAVASWFVTDGLVRRFVLAVTNVANGGSPAEQLDFVEVEGDFQVRSRDGRLVIDPASYRRYDPLVAAFVSLDPDGAAALYRRLRPLFDEAYRELGLGGGDFEPVLARAVENLMAVRLPSPPVEVGPKEAGYGYLDPELEARTPAEKHLMRTGPENARRVQDKLAELARALGLDAAQAGAAR
jgi:hypothetical protein